MGNCRLAKYSSTLIFAESENSDLTLSAFPGTDSMPAGLSTTIIYSSAYSTRGSAVCRFCASGLGATSSPLSMCVSMGRHLERHAG